MFQDSNDSAQNDMIKQLILSMFEKISFSNKYTYGEN